MRFETTCTHQSCETFQVVAHLDASEDLDAKEKRAIVIVCEVVLTWTAATNLALDDTGSAPAKLARAYLHPFLLTARNPLKPVALPGERFNATKEEARLVEPLPEDALGIAEKLVQGYVRINRALILARL